MSIECTTRGVLCAVWLLAAERARLLVLDLASESYRAREEASRGLWELGVIGIEAIKKGVKSADPEVAYRSKILLQRIRTGITPDTPKSVVALVQKYFRSGTNGKKAVFESLLKERAYTQVLRIYRHEEDEASREACEEIVEKNDAVARFGPYAQHRPQSR